MPLSQIVYPQVILLTDFTTTYGQRISRTMGAYVLASQLEEAGIRTNVIDHFTKHGDLFTLIESMASEELVLIGISSTFLSPRKLKEFQHNAIDDQSMYSSGYLWCETAEELNTWLSELKKRIDQKSPKVKLLLGGAKTGRAFAAPEAYKQFDYFILGAGDQTIVDLARNLTQGKKPEVQTKNDLPVYGTISLKKTQGTCPQTSYLPRWGLLKNESLPIEVARGCKFNCKFCYYEKRFSVRKDLETLRDEFHRNYDLFGTTVYHFCDDCFNDSRSKVEELCNLFLKLPFKIDWVSYARVDVAVKFPETAELMVESGARGLFWGLESLHADTAKRAGKGTPPDQVKEFLIDFKKRVGHKCLTGGSFIAGLPGEPEESLFDTRDWILNSNALDFLYYNLLEIIPFNSKLDQVLVDYADYSRNPQKYGFSEIRFQPKLYWKHATMDIDRARQIALEISNAWTKKHPANLIQSLWAYPEMRTLGYSHDDVVTCLTRAQGAAELEATYLARAKKYREQYFKNLQQPYIQK